MNDADLVRYIHSLLVVDSSGRFYQRIGGPGGTLKRFRFDNSADVAWLNEKIKTARKPEFHWNVQRVPSCARLIMPRD